MRLHWPGWLTRWREPRGDPPEEPAVRSPLEEVQQITRVRREAAQIRSEVDAYRLELEVIQRAERLRDPSP